MLDAYELSDTAEIVDTSSTNTIINDIAFFIIVVSSFHLIIDMFDPIYEKMYLNHWYHRFRFHSYTMVMITYYFLIVMVLVYPVLFLVQIVENIHNLPIYQLWLFILL